jgi:putative transposase
VVERWRTNGAEQAMLRAAAVRRLARLQAVGQLTNDQAELVAEVLGVSSRTVWRWLAEHTGTGRTGRKPRARFEMTDELVARLAYHRGNVARLHDELAGQARALGRPVVSVDTLERAVKRALTSGDLAALRKGERERRKYDVFLRRPPTHRNAVWEGDHVEASVRVDVDGELRKPWITWFIDTGTNAILGVAITPTYPTRESVLVALRACISRREGFGPIGGLPGAIRVDRGKDFLSKAVRSAMAVFGVEMIDLPGYSPHLKGRIEAVNGAVKKQRFAQLPGYTEAPTGANGKPLASGTPPLSFEAFVAEVFDWIAWWNTEHQMTALGGRTPLQAWEADPTPIEEVDEKDLVLFTMEDEGTTREITTDGVAFHSRHYVGDWMVGCVGDTVRVRWLPNHPEIIEVFDARTGEHRGSAYPNDEASEEQRKSLIATRARKSREAKAAARAADAKRKVRYAAATTAAPPQALGSISALEAEVELAEDRDTRTKPTTRPDLFARRAPATRWARPRAIPAAPRSDDDEQQGERT